MRSALVACVLSIGLSACAAPPPPAEVTDDPKTETIWLIQRGWHTDIGLIAEATGPALTDIRNAYPGVRTLIFGFGERNYLLHSQHDSGDMIAALFPSPGAILVTALRTDPDAAFPMRDVVAIQVSGRQRARLAAFIADALTRDPDGAHRAIAVGPYPGSGFYASTRTYSLTFTCNTWTAEGLQTAGLPVHANGVLFTDGVMRQARRAEIHQ